MRLFRIIRAASEHRDRLAQCGDPNSSLLVPKPFDFDFDEAERALKRTMLGTVTFLGILLVAIVIFLAVRIPADRVATGTGSFVKAASPVLTKPLTDSSTSSSFAGHPCSVGSVVVLDPATVTYRCAIFTTDAAR